MSVWSTPKSTENHARQIRRNVDACEHQGDTAVYLDFDRQGADLESTIISAIKDIESANIGAMIVSVAPEHLVSLSDIAERVSITRQAVSLLMQGTREIMGFAPSKLVRGGC